MTSWLSEYSAALDVRDAREQAQNSYITAYTKLADRLAIAEASHGTNTSTVHPASPAPAGSQPSTPSAKGKGHAENETPTSNDAVSKLRTELAMTQKARSGLEGQLKAATSELENVKVLMATSAKKLEEVMKDRAQLERKVRDREHEIKEKGTLLRDGQDELVSLTLQLNMAEQRADDLKKENRELVERWMKRMGKEADAMNDATGWS